MTEPGYLWDKSGPPDPEVERLEQLLGGVAYQRPAAPVPALRRRPRWRVPMLAAAALVLVAAGAWLALRGRHRAEAGWQMSGVAGHARLHVGEWLETDASSHAKLAVADIGQVEVAPSTRLRLKATGPGEHRLELARGTISARVNAPPRLLVVETPSANAVDLGCAYTLTVDPSGGSQLHVSSGYVALEQPGQSVYVPEGASCETRPKLGPGTPAFDDAQPALHAALHDFDFAGGGADALDGALTWARPRDTLSLFHLVARTRDAERERVVDRILALSRRGLPAGITRERVLALEPEALERWRHDLETDW